MAFAEKFQGKTGRIARTGAGIVYREGDAPPNAHTHHNVQGGMGSSVPEMMGTFIACKESPKDRPLTIMVDTASVLPTLARCIFRTC